MIRNQPHDVIHAETGRPRVKKSIDAEQKENVMVCYTGACTWYVRSKLSKHGPAMPLNTRCRAWLDQL